MREVGHYVKRLKRYRIWKIVVVGTYAAEKRTKGIHTRELLHLS